MDYKDLFSKLEQTLDKINRSEDRVADLSAMSRLVVDEFHEALNLTAGRVYVRRDDEYVLHDQYPEAGAPEGISIPADYPPIRELQEVSIRVANRVMECAIREGLARQEGLESCDLDTYLRKRFWKPRYLPFVRGA